MTYLSRLDDYLYQTIYKNVYCSVVELIPLAKNKNKIIELFKSYIDAHNIGIRKNEVDNMSESKLYETVTDCISKYVDPKLNEINRLLHVKKNKPSNQTHQMINHKSFDMLYDKYVITTQLIDELSEDDPIITDVLDVLHEHEHDGFDISQFENTDEMSELISDMDQMLYQSLIISQQYFQYFQPLFAKISRFHNSEGTCISYEQFYDKIMCEKYHICYDIIMLMCICQQKPDVSQMIQTLYDDEKKRDLNDFLNTSDRLSAEYDQYNDIKYLFLI